MSDSGNKTEEPTPKRLREARNKGNVAISKDVTALVGYTGFLFIIYGLGDYYFLQMIEYYEQFLKMFEEKDRELLSIVTKYLPSIFFFILIPSILLAIASIVGNVIQVGFLFSLEPLKFDLNKINPVKNINKVISKKNLFDTFKSAVKVFFASLVLSYIIYNFLGILSSEIICREQCLFNMLKATVGTIFLSFFMLFFVLSIIDYGVQYYFWKKELMMTKEEIKKEYEDMEGKPEIKQKRKEFQNEILEESDNRAQLCDAIITNPTHIAIGIYFKENNNPVPLVILKVTDDFVDRVKNIARNNQIPIIENPPLARKLHESAEMDSPVPEDLMRPVIKILRWIKGQ